LTAGVRLVTRDRGAIALGLLAPLAGALILLPLRAHWSNTNVALLLVVIVVAVAAIGNGFAGALAALSAFAWFDFFFTRPYLRFTISRSADVTTAVLLLLVGLAVSQLAAWARRLRVLSVTDAGYLELVHAAAELTRTARSPDAVVEYVKGRLIELLGLESCRFEYGSLVGQPVRLQPDGSVLAGHQRWDVEEFGFPAGEVEIRTFSGGDYIGRFMLVPKPASKPSLQARLVAVTLADQAGRALGSAGTAGARATDIG
jgi:K+-sensing histidine kinase KdpD